MRDSDEPALTIGQYCDSRGFLPVSSDIHRLTDITDSERFKIDE
jgi:hypothetical protein